MNTPYIKKVENGKVVNPITVNNPFINSFPNRRQRRDHIQKERFCKNTKACHMTVTDQGRYYRRRQTIVLKNGSKKTIEHYILFKRKK
jgi:hypothetical protein